MRRYALLCHILCSSSIVSVVNKLNNFGFKSWDNIMKRAHSVLHLQNSSTTGLVEADCILTSITRKEDYRDLMLPVHVKREGSAESDDLFMNVQDESDLINVRTLLFNLHESSSRISSLYNELVL